MKFLLQKLVETHFPIERVKYAVGYGSAVFKQANYETPNLVIDMLLFVDDTKLFHQQNINGPNQQHYSYFAKRLPLEVTDGVQNSGAGIYFNPLIPLRKFPGMVQSDSDNRRIKYGVMQIDNAINDLNQWETFGLAGRLQKPVLPFIQDCESFEVAMQQNCENAAYLALLILYDKLEPVTMQEFFEILCAFSFKGDIRMKYKMENPLKVKNIVSGSLEQLTQLYLPLLLEFQSQGHIQFQPDGRFIIRHSSKGLQQIFDRLPDSIKRGMKKSVNQLSVQELQQDVQKNLQSKVLITSVQMLMSGMYTTSPLTGLKYLSEKFKKGRQQK